MPLRDALVRSINPRLHFYSKPVLLALIIAAVTLGVVGLMFAILISNCPEDTMVAESTSFGTMTEHVRVMQKIKENVGKTESAGARTETNIEICLKYSQELIAFTHPNYHRSVAGAPQAMGYVPCFMNDADVDAMDLKWCSPQHQANQQTHCAASGTEDDAPTCRRCGDAAGIENDIPTPQVPFSIFYESSTAVRKCPSYTSAFGIALGYAAYLVPNRR